MKKFLVTVIACILASAWSQGATIYDWKNDWQGTGTQPDSGVWYYKGCGWNETVPSTYADMGWDTNHWYYSNPGWWYFIRNGNMDHYQNAWDILAWKAPTEGTAAVSLSGSVSGWGNCPVYLQIVDGDGTILSDNTIAAGGTFSYSLPNLSVAKDDYLYIRVRSETSYMNTSFDTMTVTLAPVPEPAALTLLALGGLLTMARRRQR